jgi:ankyrin repeat protein
VDLLPKGSMLYTTDTFGRSSFTGFVQNVFYHNLQANTNFFADFLENFSVNIANGGILKMAGFKQKLDFKFDLTEVVLKPKETLLTAQKSFLDFYADLYQEAKNLKDNDYISYWGDGTLSAHDFTNFNVFFFRQAYFVYASLIFDEDEIVDTLQAVDENMLYELAQGINLRLPTHLLALNNYTKALELLLPYVYDINQFDFGQQTALLYAILSDNLSSVSILIENGADVNLRKSELYYTPIIAATIMNNLEIVKILIDNGADVNSQISSGLSALHYAALYNHYDIALELITAGAQLNTNLTVKGYTPLHLACQFANIDLAIALIEHGANLDARTTYENYTPLMFAVENNYYDIAIELLKAGADKGIINNFGYDAYDIATNNDYYKIVNAFDYPINYTGFDIELHDLDDLMHYDL